jgi:hypothetical protein
MLGRQKYYGSKVSFSLAFLMFFSFALTRSAQATEIKSHVLLTAERETSDSPSEDMAPFRCAGNATTTDHPEDMKSSQEERNNSRETTYSNLVGTDIWNIRPYVKDPEVIFGLFSESVRYGSRKISVQVDFAYFPARFPQERGPAGLDPLLDDELFLGDPPDLNEEDVELEDGLVGLSVFAHFPSPSGKLSPYLWLRGMRKPLPGGATPEVSVKYATSVQGGIPLRIGHLGFVRVEGGFILGIDEDTGELLQAHGATLTLNRAF